MQGRKILAKLQAYKVQKTEEELKKKYGTEKIIKLNANENPYGTSAKVLQSMKEIKDISKYPDGYCMQLREALAKKYNISKECFLFGDASNEIIQMITKAYLEQGEEVITSIPGFSLYESATIMQEGKLVGVPLKDDKLDLEGILNKISDKTRIIFITNPHNPTGTIITKEEQEEFIKKVPKEVLVVIDEAYYEFVCNKQFPNSIELLNQYSNLCILRTFSKAYGLAGLRVGYGIASPECIQILEKVKNPYNISVIAQKAAVQALKDSFMEETVEKNKKIVKAVSLELEKLGMEYCKTESNFIFINMEMEGKEILEAFLKEGIMVRVGYPNYETWARVSIGTEDQMKEFIKVLKKIRKVM